MPFDTMTMAAVVDEVNSATSGGRIQRIIQSSLASVGIAIYSGGTEQWLLLSADAQRARVHLSSLRLTKAFDTPSAFVMLLRKYLEGARVANVTQTAGERIFHLACRRGDHQPRLVAEVMGKHSNVILVDESNRVLGALKTITLRLSRVRPIMPGEPYRPPPVQERDSTLYPPGPRVNPYLDASSFGALLAGVPSGTVLRNALLGILPGGSPFLADQIALRAGSTPTAAVEAVDLAAIAKAAGQFFALYETRTWRPCTFSNQRGRIDVAPYIPVGMSDLQERPSMSLAVELSLGGDESRDRLGPARAAVLADLARLQRAADRKLTSLQQGLEASEDAETVMQWGQLVLAYQHAIVPRSTQLVIPELDVTIPLDPRLTPLENAERLFRRYRKLRDARKRLPALLAATEAQVARLQDAAVFAGLATSEADLRDLRNTLSPARQPAGTKHAKTANTRKRVPAGPARFSFDSYTALVGRNAQENEDVTFRLARRDDLWLHVRERTGAHVVLQSRSGEAPPEVVEHAARLAAYFSEGRSDTRVDVDVTLVRSVRKIPGGPPGRVTYRNFRTVRVEPGIAPWRAQPKK